MPKVPERSLSYGEILENERLKEREAKKPRRNYTPQQLIEKRRRADAKHNRPDQTPPKQ